MLASPCTNVCKLDEVTGWCRGCARDVAEITIWRRSTEAEQQLILDRLPERRLQLQQAGQWLGPPTVPVPQP